MIQASSTRRRIRPKRNHHLIALDGRTALVKNCRLYSISQTLPCPYTNIPANPAAPSLKSWCAPRPSWIARPAAALNWTRNFPCSPPRQAAIRHRSPLAPARVTVAATRAARGPALYTSPTSSRRRRRWSSRPPAPSNAAGRLERSFKVPALARPRTRSFFQPGRLISVDSRAVLELID